MAKKQPNVIPDEMLAHLLRQAGWLPATGRVTKAMIVEATDKYQEFHELKRDKYVGPITRHHLLQYRYCGLADNFVSKGCWDRAKSLELHWGVTGDPPQGISMPDWKQFIQTGWDAWSQHIKLRVAYTQNSKVANVVIKCEVIDGRMGTLGMSGLPPMIDYPLFRSAGSPNVLQQTYDWEERWEIEVSLLDTVTHENGHAWGCPHLPAGNLMQPYSDPKIRGPQKGDISEGVDLYGKAEPEEPVDPIPGLPEMQAVTIRLYGYGIRAEVVG